MAREGESHNRASANDVACDDTAHRGKRRTGRAAEHLRWAVFVKGRWEVLFRMQMQAEDVSLFLSDIAP